MRQSTSLERSLPIRAIQAILLLAAMGLGSGTAFGCVSTWADTSFDGTYAYASATIQDDSTEATLQATVDFTDPTETNTYSDSESGVDEASASVSVAVGTDYGTYNATGTFDDPNGAQPADATIWIGASSTTYKTTGHNALICFWATDCPGGTTPTCTGGFTIVWNGVSCDNWLVVPYLSSYKSGIRHCFPIVGTMGQPQYACT